MSDAALRELERAWRTSNDPADEARWHQARVRAGALAPERLALAAALGWPGAVSPGEPQARDLDRWPGLHRLGSVLSAEPEATDRALIAEGERVLALLQGLTTRQLSRQTRAFTALLRAALDRAIARTISPRDAAIEPARSVARLLPPDRPRWAHRALQLLVAFHARERQGPRGVDWDTLLPATAQDATYVLGDAARDWPRAIRAALRDALSPWALGLRDPLRERSARALDTIEIATPCRASWADMQGDDRVRHCGQCNLHVHDLSALPRAEAEALLKANGGGRLCVRLYRRKDGKVLTQDCPTALEELGDRERFEFLGKVAGPF